MRVGEVLPEASRDMGLALAQRGDKFPSGTGLMSPFSEAAATILGLVNNQSTPQNKLEMAKDVLSEASSLLFALKCHRWFTIESGISWPEEFVEEAEDQIARHLINRISNEADPDLPYFEIFGNQSTGLLNLWVQYGEDNSATDYIENVLGKHPEKVSTLIKCYLSESLAPGEIRFGESGLSLRAYRLLIQLIDPEKIVGIYEDMFQNDLVILDEYPRSEHFENAPELFFALQFMWIHQRYKNSLSQFGSDTL